MFRVTHLIHNIKSVPIDWIFQYFCKIDESLVGQEIKIFSLFTEEKTPSMFIYVDKKTQQYKFKDFSSGRGGSAVDLIKHLKGLTYHEACRYIIQHYNDYIINNGKHITPPQTKKSVRYRVSDFKKRVYESHDSSYWGQFNINIKLLTDHNVYPLEEYVMTKEDGSDSFIIRGRNIYGFFKKDGTLVKIYQPRTKTQKFLNVNTKDYLQGSEQLINNKCLLILSSLKDIMSTKSLGLRIDMIAPNSENTFIDEETMKELKKKYQSVVVLFDNDEAGESAANRYKEKYPFIKVARLPLSKDISDSIMEHGVDKVFSEIVPILDKKLNEIG